MIPMSMTRLRYLPGPCVFGEDPLKHLLSSCTKAFTNRCYHRRHDQVLKVVGETVTAAIQSSKHHLRKTDNTAPDWQLTVDLGKQVPWLHRAHMTWSSSQTPPSRWTCGADCALAITHGGGSCEEAGQTTKGPFQTMSGPNFAGSCQHDVAWVGFRN